MSTSTRLSSSQSTSVTPSASSVPTLASSSRVNGGCNGSAKFCRFTRFEPGFNCHHDIQSGAVFASVDGQFGPDLFGQRSRWNGLALDPDVELAGFHLDLWPPGLHWDHSVCEYSRQVQHWDL